VWLKIHSEVRVESEEVNRVSSRRRATEGRR